MNGIATNNVGANDNPRHKTTPAPNSLPLKRPLEHKPHRIGRHREQPTDRLYGPDIFPTPETDRPPFAISRDLLAVVAVTAGAVVRAPKS